MKKFKIKTMSFFVSGIALLITGVLGDMTAIWIVGLVFIIISLTVNLKNITNKK